MCRRDSYLGLFVIVSLNRKQTCRWDVCSKRCFWWKSFVQDFYPLFVSWSGKSRLFVCVKLCVWVVPSVYEEVKEIIWHDRKNSTLNWVCTLQHRQKPVSVAWTNCIEMPGEQNNTEQSSPSGFAFIPLLLKLRAPMNNRTLVHTHCAYQCLWGRTWLCFEHTAVSITCAIWLCIPNRKWKAAMLKQYLKHHCVTAESECRRIYHVK